MSKFNEYLEVRKNMGPSIQIHDKLASAMKLLSEAAKLMESIKQDQEAIDINKMIDKIDFIHAIYRGIKYE